VQAGDGMRYKINWQHERGRGSVECKTKRYLLGIHIRGKRVPKYIVIFTYSNGTWARMIESPGDRTAAVQRTLESLGGSLECLYWEVGTHDGYAIVELADSTSAEAMERAMSKAGALKSIETHELLSQKQLIDTLHLARDAAQVYEVPGQSD
jgi:uncharacterized protein with GYD domain